jgi:integrase
VTVAVSSPRAAASVWLAGYRSARTRFPPRPAAADWPAARAGRDQVEDLLGKVPAGRHQGGRGLLLDWLEDQDGDSWQQRWLASGAEEAGTTWWQLPARRPGSRDLPGMRRFGALTAALIAVIAGDVVRPSLAWLAAAGCEAELARGMAAARDPQGFARLADLCDHGPGGPVPKTARTHTLRRAAVIMAAKGGMLADIEVGDLLELLDTEADVLGTARAGAAACYRLLRQLGTFGPAAPTRLRELRTAGQRTPEEMIGRHNLACRPIRDLLVDYLRERQPGIDYGSLEELARKLGMFWADLEAHHPGIDSLHLSAEVADGWKQRMRTKPKTITAADGTKTVIETERICHREFLTPVRAFYLDLAQWAVEDPGRWARWAVPCPVGAAETIQGKVQRHRKSRMDARTRERLPVLPVLVRSAARQHADAAALAQAARGARPGDVITAGGQVLARAASSASASIWAEDLTTGKRRNLTAEEDRAFWAWAAIEVLRATGVRAEELVQLSHHSLVQYRLPGTGELVPLLQIAPSKTDAERLLVVSPELADVLSAVISRIRGNGPAVPLVAAYDDHERVWLPPAPVLFQRRIGAEHRAIPAATIRKLLAAALARTGLTDPSGAPLHYTLHDFRRMFLTDAIMSGLPPHIAQMIAGHRDINVTLGYKAVYPDEAIQAHLAFLARRRALRPTEEYRTPTDAEWQEFLGHFERRKVATGTCGRAFGTPCSHEHSCFSELAVSFLFVRFLIWIWEPGGMGDSADDEARIAAVDAGQGVVEADEGPAGDAGGQEEHPAFSSAGGKLAGVQGGDGGFPVDAGEQGDAVADAGAGSDEPAGEVVAVQPAAAVDEQAGAGLEGVDAAGAGAQRAAEPARVQGGHCCPSGPGTERPAMSGNAGMPRWVAWSWRRKVASIWASLSSAPARLTLRPSISPGHPSRSASAMRSCRLSRISSSRLRWAGSGLKSEHLTHACSWTQGDANARAHVPTKTFRFSK